MSAGKHPPVRALVLSLAALAIPVAGAFWVPGALQDYEALLWMLAVVPAFLLAYYRAWRGAAIALASAMAVVSVTYAVTQFLVRPMPELILPVLVLVIGVSLGIGALADRLHRDAGHDTSRGFIDPATGLPNRAHADLFLESEFKTAAGRSFAVVLFDIDNFKGYNSRYGSIAGDEVLRMVAEVLKKMTRRMNLSARYAEDEFISILSGATEENAIAYVRRFMQTLHEFAGERALPPLSGGIAVAKPAMTSHHELLKAARAALKQAKQDGRGRVRVYGSPLEFSVEPMPAVPQVEVPAAPTVLPESPGRGRRALIVAEQPDVRSALSRYLLDQGFEVAHCSNIVDGVQALTNEFDLLFSDLSLHEDIGTELVRAAKLRWPSIQVIGLVPQTNGPLLIETLNAGVDRYVVTPPDLEKVSQHITELLARRDRLLATLLERRQLRLEYEARTQDALRAFRQTEEEYHSILRNVQEVIFRTDADGLFTYLNEAWTQVTGFEAEESVGRAVSDYVHADDRKEFIATLRTLSNGARPDARAEIRVIARDGTMRWLELRAVRSYDADAHVTGAHGTLEDVTARKQAEEALRRSEAASRGLLVALPDRVLQITRDGVVLDSEGKVAGTVAQVFPESVVAQLPTLIETVLADDVVQVHEYASSEAEEARNFELRLAPGSDDTVVAVLRDITDRSLLEAQLRQSQKLEAIGRLAGGLAHDFNNLLTIIQGNTHLLHEETQGSQVREYLQQINVAAERGAALVRQLLAFGRRQVLQPSVLNLNTLVENTRAMLDRLIGEQIRLEVDLDPEAGLIRGDAGQIQQVLVNLAVNARDVLRDRGTLRIATSKSALVAHAADEPAGEDMVLLTVSDDGPGMDAATLEHIFEPFFTTKGLANASGLGLATVYGIVRQSGGTISVSSEPGQGTTFEIAFPRVVD